MGCQRDKKKKHKSGDGLPSIFQTPHWEGKLFMECAYIGGIIEIEIMKKKIIFSSTIYKYYLQNLNFKINFFVFSKN